MGRQAALPLRRKGCSLPEPCLTKTQPSRTPRRRAWRHSWSCLTLLHEALFFVEAAVRPAAQTFEHAGADLAFRVVFHSFSAPNCLRSRNFATGLASLMQLVMYVAWVGLIGLHRPNPLRQACGSICCTALTTCVKGSPASIGVRVPGGLTSQDMLGALHFEDLVLHHLSIFVPYFPELGR